MSYCCCVDCYSRPHGHHCQLVTVVVMVVVVDDLVIIVIVSISKVAMAAVSYLAARLPV